MPSPSAAVVYAFVMLAIAASMRIVESANDKRTTTHLHEWRNRRFAKLSEQLLETGIGADVHFQVGRAKDGELISAHKIVLSVASDVFQSQLLRYNHNGEGSTVEKAIEVPEISADAFRAMLNFIYTLDISVINKQNVLEVYTAGDRYLIVALVYECRIFLSNHMDIDDVIPLLKFAQHYEDKSLIEYCWKFVEKNGKAVVDSEEFFLMEEADLRALFSRDFPGINELKKHLLDTGRAADVYFLVGKEKKELISAHKFMLDDVSYEFGGKFLRRFNVIMNGSEEGSTKENPIEVPDISPDTFRTMLHFICASDISGINKHNVLEVYTEGHKYEIHTLVKECRKFLLNNHYLDMENLFFMLKFAQHHKDKILIEHCWNFVDKNAKLFFKSEEFCKLEQADLCELFGRNTLKEEEIFLFQKLHHWAIHKCEAEGLAPTEENKRKAIGAAIYKIRLPLLTKQQFIEHIVPTGLLNEDDITAMEMFYEDCVECCRLGDCGECANLIVEDDERQHHAMPRHQIDHPSAHHHHYCPKCADKKCQFPNRFSSRRRGV